MEDARRDAYDQEREEAMQRLTPVILLAVPVLCLIAGCAVSGHQRYAHRIEATGLIFNPSFTLSRDIHVPRTGWPSTPAYEHTQEYVEYRETIIDRQSTYGYADDFLYRRFDSVRVGRARR